MDPVDHMECLCEIVSPDNELDPLLLLSGDGIDLAYVRIGTFGWDPCTYNIGYRETTSVSGIEWIDHLIDRVHKDVHEICWYGYRYLVDVLCHDR